MKNNYDEFIHTKDEEPENKPSLIERPIYLIPIVMIATIFVLGRGIYDLKNSFDEVQQEIAIDKALSDELNTKRESYTYYLDGKKVDFDKIDPEQYDVSYDDENQKAYMTKHVIKKISIF